MKESATRNISAISLDLPGIFVRTENRDDIEANGMEQISRKSQSRVLTEKLRNVSGNLARFR